MHSVEAPEAMTPASPDRAHAVGGGLVDVFDEFTDIAVWPRQRERVTSVDHTSWMSSVGERVEEPEGVVRPSGYRLEW
jgi:hypothetical protein